ncbi:hypothetical protein OHA70_14240 [Kribbella sp. NBC_00382]|uniref:DUF222 domain-containing protein n=1 Tax=Kribbella sp. NBC_00382 TaxID=2975967 RepID=UPI002E1EDCFF
MFASNDLSDLTARETLSSVGELHVQRNRIDVEILRHALHFADLHPGTATVSDHDLVGGGEQSRVYGGSGCPSVAEFAVAEFGVMIGRTTGSAAKFMGQALALRHRLPRTWAQVESGHATAWKACNVATACNDLSEDAASIVDRRVAPIVDSLSPLRLHNIVKAALWEADPITARARAEEKARERGVWAGRTDEHGTTTLYIKAPTGSVIRIEATINQLANTLAALGDTSGIDERRVRAAEVLADPALAADLLQVARHLTTPTADNPTPPTAPAPSEPDNGSSAVPPAATAQPAPSHPTEPTSPGEPNSSGEPSPAAEPSPPVAAATPAAAQPIHDDGGSIPADTSCRAAMPPLPRATRLDEQVDAAADSRLDAPTDPRLNTSAESRLKAPVDSQVECWPRDSVAEGNGSLDGAARRELVGKLAAIKKNSMRQPTGTMIYLHLTDEALFAGEGVARVEGFGPVLVTRLEELIGHGDVIVKPVIDLRERLSADSYEIPQRIRERIKLRYPAEQFVYGTGDSSRTVDLDHIEPFRPNGPPGQTNTDNLIPLRRFSHRVKTHGGWQVRRLTDDALEWTTRHGFKFIVDHQGTHLVDRQ